MERGLSVPDAEMLLSLGEVFDTPVSALLGKTVIASGPDSLQALSEKLEVLNAQFARAQELKRLALNTLCISLAVAVALILLALGMIGGSYLDWDFTNPEYAIAGTMLHGFEWIFVRIAPFILIAAIAGAIATRKRG